MIRTSIKGLINMNDERRIPAMTGVIQTVAITTEESMNS
jgi:hypothetical protein